MSECMRQYIAFCRNPETGTEARFGIQVLTADSADIQARDSFWGPWVRTRKSALNLK